MEFRGKWTKLSNYSACTVWFEGHIYTSVEHAYQAQKSTDPAVQKVIREAPTPAVAKRMARALPLREDWEEVKYGLMLELVRQKFCQEPERSILLATGYEHLIEGNWWHDNVWGNCSCGPCESIVGQNALGTILMLVRDELRD